MSNVLFSKDFQAKFHQRFRIAFIGSVIYEISKTLHNFFLIKLLVPEEYGMISSFLAFTYLLTKVSDLGASTSIISCFHLIASSKENFKKIMFKHYLIPHLPLTVFVILVFIFLLHQTKLPQINSATTLLLVGLIVFFEALRAFLRLFMYTALQTKSVVVLEITTFSVFLGCVWLPYAVWGTLPSFKYILWLHLIESGVTVAVLLFLLIKFYAQLPDICQPINQNLTFNIIKTKFLNYLLRLSRELFSTHFLTPFFAMRLGIKYAGIFYFATIIAHSLSSIFKISIGYMGNALFANLKQGNNQIKQQAFSILCHKLSKICIPLTIFILINVKGFLNRATSTKIDASALLLPILFLFILIIDFVLSLYEQLYISQDATSLFLGFKLFEFLLFVGLIQLTSNQTPVPLFLIGIIFIKMLSFGIISFSAFKSWQIQPTTHTTLKQITIYAIISVLISIALKQG